ncbi:hypothetical protein FOA52_013229 [Chlamydomonas sp. UWO 241]|nr:hypothetical protein FOA52_013229 [Chlamydomonas sp. UWO 241]
MTDLQQPSCKADSEFNFGSASGRDDLVYGAARPGARSQRCFKADDQVTEAEVTEWAEFMKGYGIKRVVGLLTSSEREQTYVAPPAELLRAAGLDAINVDVEVDGPAGARAVLAAVTAAVAANERVVVHCWGGGGRTGRLLAAYLVTQYGLSPEDAASEIGAHAKASGCSRRVDVAALTGALAGPCS